MKGVVYRKKTDDLVLEVGLRPKRALISLFQGTVWGGKGARFQTDGIESRLAGLTRPLFMSLEKGGEVIGGYCFSRRRVSDLGQTRPIVFRTAFAVGESHAGNGYGSLLARAAKKFLEEKADLPSYGFVEANNVRSLEALKSARYGRIGSFEPVVFGRLRPRRKIAFQRVQKREFEPWRDRLHQAYKDHVFVHFDSLNCGDGFPYFVARRGGEVVAGVQARLVRLRVKEIGGPFGPLLRWGFAPASCRFLTFEAVYWRPERLEELFDLLESLLCAFGVRCGLFFLDRASSLYGGLKSSGRLGLFDRLLCPQPIHVMGAGAHPKAGPFYVSAFDVI